MNMRVQKLNMRCPKFCFINEYFEIPEIEKILFLEKILDFMPGTTSDGSDVKENKEARSCSVGNLMLDENSAWIYEKLARVIPQVNYDLFMLNIEGISPIQFVVYEGETNDHYDWHYDTMPFWSEYERKISGVIFLSNFDEYEGGELHIATNGNPEKSEILRPNKGDMVLFSSNYVHKVFPVTSGKRKTLVFWVEGKRE